ncbi:MAG TPA: flagellar hook-associated protein FlgL [Longimicrobiaceae bacterium]
MRITNNIIQRNALASLQANARALAIAQQRVSTGLRVERASDDPAAAGAIMGAQSSLRAIEQYRRNIDSARAFTAAEETALGSLTQILDRARELATMASSATADQAARDAALVEVEQLYDHAISLANTQVGNRYIFGGANADTAPLDSDGVPTAADPAAPGPSVQIGRAVTIRTNHSAQEVFTDTGVLDALAELRQALQNGQPDEIADAGEALRTASRSVQNLLGEVGVWADQLDITTANLDALDLNLKTFKADLQEVDFEEAMTDLIGRQTAYQAAMLATSRVMGMTLADYLR